MEVKGTLFFMAGTKMSLAWPRQAGHDPATIASTVKAPLESDKLLVEVHDSLLVIPTRNIKYLQITPPPERLPSGVVLGARIVD